jgi:S-adenosylmethionine hydrolase
MVAEVGATTEEADPKPAPGFGRSPRTGAGRIVTLTSDFGTRDGYVGAMKGAILRRAPDARLVDVAHDIEPGAIAQAAYAWSQAAPWFPPDTVHLAVVDPGVGTARRGIAARAGEHWLVAPDNGVLTPLLDAAGLETMEVRSLENAALWNDDPSPVFHGRDVFGPVAGHLAAGGTLADVGGLVDPATLVRLPTPVPEHAGDRVRGEVVHVDRFGNLITNLGREHLGDAGSGAVDVQVGEHRVPLVRTYADVPEGALLALVGSAGRLEIARHRGSAARELGGIGLVVSVRRPPRSER